MDLLKDFDCRIQYYPRKENVVVDALSRKGIGVLSHLMVSEWDLRRAIQ